MRKFVYILFCLSFLVIINGCLITIGTKQSGMGQIKGENEQNQETDYNFDMIDSHVLKTPKSKESNLKALVEYLIQPANNDLEKTRAIFRWISENISYDVNALYTGNYGDLSANGVLKSKKSVCEGYANLFFQMAEYAKLKCVKIAGYAKGAGYLVGNPIPSGSNHAWNAVNISGEWKLLDCTWGAGYMNQAGKFVKRFEDHYFLTLPSIFIYDHFPEEPKWQLLSTPISKAEYEKMPHVLPMFFICGLSIIDHGTGVIKSGEKSIISFHADYDCSFIAKFTDQNGKDISSANAVFRKKDNGFFDVEISFQKKGTYYIFLFAKEGLNPSGQYEWACDFKIIADF